MSVQDAAPAPPTPAWLEVRDGEAVIPDPPGFGTELHEEALARYSLDDWG